MDSRHHQRPQHGSLVSFVLALCHTTLKTWLDGLENSLHTLLRESVAYVQRALNGSSAWLIGVFHRGYKAQLKGRWSQLSEQYATWGGPPPSSTLNAVLARECSSSAGGGTPPAGAADAPAAAAQPAAAPPQPGLRQRRAGAAAAEPAGQQPAAAAHKGRPPEIQPAGDEENDSSSSPPVQDGSAASDEQQWFAPSTWLSGIADEASEAAAAAQEAASAAVQQAATSVSQAVEEAAATAAAWARSMRAVFVEPPAGWGVHEAIHRTGLLEDVSLQGQLLISRCFDALRWLLAKLTFTGPAPAATPTAAVAGQRPSTAGASSSGAGAGVFSRMHRLLSPGGAVAVGGAAGAPGHAHIRGRLKLRSVTSVDLPRTHTMHLEVSDEEHMSSCSDWDASSADESCSPDAYAEAQQEPRAAARAPAGTSQHAAATAAASKAAGLPGLTVRVPDSGSRIKPSGRVSFAAGEGGAAVDASPAAAGVLRDGPSPFGTAAVQTRHQADIDAAAAPTPPGRRASPDPSAGRSSTGSTAGGGAAMPGSGKPLQRSHSGPPVSALRDVTSAGQVIRMAGYPLETHEVVTADGYLLRLERIPLPASRDVVFMMHGVLDTSLTWVAGGITGSQAFAAFDRGFDVWLGTSRSNPPHEAVDPQRRGSAYWLYTNNEVGVYDMGAQLDHIHAIKMRELAGQGRSSKRSGSSRRGSRAAASGSGGRRSSSTSAQPVMQQQAGGGGSGSGHRDILAGLLGSGDDGTASGGGVPSVVFEASEGGGPEGAGGPADSADAAAGSTQQLQLHSATSSGGDSSGSRDDLYQPAMSRTPSAAEIDEAAAAEATEALSRHRAAMAAAGVAAPAAAQQQDDTGPPQEPATPRQHGVLLTPTAAAAAAAAARAANALGSAVAAAAAAASGVVGAAASGVAAAAGGTPRADADAGGGSDSSADGCHVHVTAHGVSLGSCDATAGAADDLARSSGNAATAVLTGASGLFERLLGGTTPLSSSNGALDGSGHVHAQKQQQQLEAYQAQRGMRHSSSAPDVSAAAADALAGAGGLAAGVSPAVEQRQQQQLASPVAAAAGASGSGGRGRIRRGSWPWSPAVAAVAADELGTQRQDTQVESAAAAAAAAGESPTAATASPFGREPQQHAHEQQQATEEQQQPPASSSSDAAGMAAAAASCSSRLASTASTASSARWDRAASARPYNLRVVAHSLGGFLALIYTTQRARAGRPHHVSRLILLSPAGFHPVIPTLFKPLVYVWRPFMAYMHWVWRQQAFPVHLPTFVVRLLAFKLSIDTTRLPAVGDLLRGFAQLVLGGDRSAWDRALLMPHYAAAGMPLLSSRQVLHFIQLYLTRRCQLFDYGSIAANVAAYQQPTPPCVSDAFHTLRDVPVHLVAGQHDGVIPPGNVQQHYRAMKAAGVDVSYRQFAYGHMDMTFSAKEELGWYVMSLLMRK